MSTMLPELQQICLEPQGQLRAACSGRRQMVRSIVRASTRSANFFSSELGELVSQDVNPLVARIRLRLSMSEHIKTLRLSPQIRSATGGGHRTT